MKRIFLKDIGEWQGSGVLSVLGPTGSGKTRTVLEWVRSRFPQKREHPLLVSIDSVAVYRELDIGSAKPLGFEREGFSWAGLDLIDPTERMTAADFLNRLLSEIEKALQTQRPVILVGGSHFYERALVEGMSPGEASDPVFQAELAPLDSESLWKRLNAHDARWGAKLHPNDRYRLTRYLDLVERQGFAWDDFMEGQATSRPWSTTATLLLGHEEAPESIRARMLRRIQEMMALGWRDEVRSLLDRYPDTAAGLGSVGYREIVASFKSGESQAELEERILTSHMQLAKKQRTWLRGLARRQS